MCNICCEPFNRTTRSSVLCMYSECDFTACKACMRQYIVGSNAEAQCMKCKKPWTTQFMVLNLNRSFVDNEYTKHYQKVLLEREISKLPDTMSAAHFAKRSLEAATPLDAKHNALQKELETLDKVIAKLKACKIRRTELINEIQECSRESTRLRRNAYRQDYDDTTNAKEKRNFIMQCPSENCRGFLSTQYKCELCSTHTCPKCFEIIGTDKNEEHTCLEDNVKSAEMIRKDTKPCPSCGTRISKISGCDQMWCVECHQAFSWNTGTIETGRIHNPHFYDYKRNQNNGIIPRAPGDVLCGGLCEHDQLQYVLRRIVPEIGDTVVLQVFHGNNGRIPQLISGAVIKNYELNGRQILLIDCSDNAEQCEPCRHCTNVTCNLINHTKVIEYNMSKRHVSTRQSGGPNLILPNKENLRKAHHLVSHITYSSLRNARANASDTTHDAETRTSRIKYILGNISKDELASNTFKAHKKKQKNLELLHIYELLSVSGIELFASLINSEAKGTKKFNDEVVNHIAEFRRLCDYCNEQFATISVTYNIKVEQISDDWSISNKQFGIRGTTTTTKK